MLQLIAAGRSNREIADELFLAVNTVRSYSQQLYGKLQVGSRTQAIVRARELGLLA
ncbi:MAG: LuxR C-terminal-related transcriptional regulator [Thermomicrobiales bacterium]